MACWVPQILLRKLLTGSLLGDEADALSQHVEFCPECQESLDALIQSPVVYSAANSSDTISFHGQFGQLPQAHSDGPTALAQHMALDRSRSAFSNPHVPVVPGYEVLEVLGRGGMGVVYKARQLTLRRTVALKMILAGEHASSVSAARLLSEAMAAAQLQHPNIVHVHGIGEHQGRPYLEMEYIGGGSLADRLGGTPLPAQSAARIVESIARAVHAAHLQGVVHRDLKPANILLTLAGAPKIADFGLAKIINAEAHLTGTDAVIGSPSYMAPEQAGGHSRDAGPACDVYALGAIFYESLTGRPPFRAATVLETLEQVRSADPVPPSRIQPGLPRDVGTICLKCLQKDPPKRYASAEQLADDLALYLSGRPVKARPTALWERALKWTKRRPATAALITITAFASMALLAIVLSYNARLSSALKVVTQERDNGDTLLQRQGIKSTAELFAQSRFSEAREALRVVPESRRGWEWNRLSLEIALVPKPVRIIGNHEWGIIAAEISPDDKTLITSGEDGRVVAWNRVTSGQSVLEQGSWSHDVRAWRHVLQAFRGEPSSAVATDCYQSLCWIDGGVTLIGASLHGKGMAWNLSSRDRTLILDHDVPLNAVAAAPGGEVLFGDNQGCLILRHPTIQKLKRVLYNGSAITKIRYVPPGYWAVAHLDGSIRLMDLTLTRAVCQASVHGPAWDLDVDGPGSFLAVASGANTLTTLKMAPGGAELRPAEVYTLPDDEGGRQRSLRTVRIAPSGNRIYGGDDRGRILMWERDRPNPFFIGQDQRGIRIPDETTSRWPAPFQRRVSAVLLAADPPEMFTAGHDTALKAWNLDNRKGIVSFQTTAGAVARFDPLEPMLLWVGAMDGTVSVWDRSTGARTASVNGHQGAVTGLIMAPNRSEAVTCGVDQTICLWARSRNDLRLTKTIRHTKSLRSVDISPNGHVLAAYDIDDSVILWDIKSGRQLSSLSLPLEGPGKAVGGLVAFSADGSRIAAAGPGQSIWLLASTNLSVVGRPYVVAGEGGTSIAWHPGDSNRLIAGDTIGRVASYSPALEPYNTDEQYSSPVTGVAYSPDGGRFAAIYQDGTLCVFDPRWVGRILTRQSIHRKPTGILFSPFGKCIAVVHRDGWIDVWDSLMSPAGPPRIQNWTWSDTLLLNADRARDLKLRAQASAVDRDDNLYLAYSKLSDSANNPEERIIMLGRQVNGWYGEEELENAGKCDGPSVDGINTSLAMRADDNEVTTIVRRETEARQGELRLFRRPLPGARPVRRKSAEGVPETLTEPSHAGLDTHLFSGPNGKPRVYHFTHSGYYLLATSWVDGKWRSEPIGQKGDGFHAQAACASDGTLHAVFRPHRFSADASSLTYLSHGPGAIRETLDDTATLIDYRLGLLPGGSPVVIYWRPGVQGREIVVARRSANSWHKAATPDWTEMGASNLVCDRNGLLRFAYCDRQGRIMLATYNAGAWQTEIVTDALSSTDAFAHEAIDFNLVVLLDSQHRPVIVASRPSLTLGWLRVFRSRK